MIADVAVAATAQAECEEERANGMAASALAFTQAWEEWLRNARR